MRPSKGFSISFPDQLWLVTEMALASILFLLPLAWHGKLDLTSLRQGYLLSAMLLIPLEALRQFVGFERASQFFHRLNRHRDAIVASANAVNVIQLEQEHLRARLDTLAQSFVAERVSIAELKADFVRAQRHERPPGWDSVRQSEQKVGAKEPPLVVVQLLTSIRSDLHELRARLERFLEEHASESTQRPVVHRFEGEALETLQLNEARILALEFRTDHRLKELKESLDALPARIEEIRRPTFSVRSPGITNEDARIRRRVLQTLSRVRNPEQWLEGFAGRVTTRLWRPEELEETAAEFHTLFFTGHAPGSEFRERARLLWLEDSTYSSSMEPLKAEGLRAFLVVAAFQALFPEVARTSGATARLIRYLEDLVSRRR
jgi:hypothetical protein